MKTQWHDYIKLLKAEVVPALGCTEPISLALAAAIAASYLDKRGIVSIKALVSPNLMKNGMGVGVPGTGMKGLSIAAAAGACGGNPAGKLEVLKGLSEEDADAARAMLASGVVSVGIKPTEKALYVECEINDGKSSATVTIEDEHSNVSSIVVDGRRRETPSGACSIDRGESERLHLLAKNTRVGEIWDFAMNAPLEKIAFMLQAAELNGRISKAGLEKDYGLRIGRTMELNEKRGILSKDLLNEIVKRSSAASDARMDGCELPAMTNSGSGNQGIAATVPVLTTAEFAGANEERLARALTLSHFVAIHIKAHLARLSALCAVTVAAMGSGCGIVYLMGGSELQCEYAIENMIGDIAGMICDGAKAGCSLKVSSSVAAAVKAALLALDGVRISAEQGIIAQEVEEAINNLGFLAKDGLKNADDTILGIMVAKSEAAVRA